MITRYSNCHFAEVMKSRFIAKHIGAEPQEAIRCSFCGEACELVPQPLTLEHDLELTLRRWKDGDCTLDDMFNRVNTLLERSYRGAFDTAKETLQAGGTPQYTLELMTMEWKTSAALPGVGQGGDQGSSPGAMDAPAQGHEAITDGEEAR